MGTGSESPVLHSLNVVSTLRGDLALNFQEMKPSENENQKEPICVTRAQKELLNHISHLDSGDIANSIERTIDLGLYFGNEPIDREDLAHVYRVRELMKYINAIAGENGRRLGCAS